MEQHLRVFVKVVELGNFSKAAEELHMTQPAVSHYIKVLEETIGTRLLERSNKYVRLNKAGEIVYHHAKEILSLYSRMQDLVDDITNKISGPISIGASYTFGEYVLPHIIARLLQQYPEITPTIQIHNTKEIADLVQTYQLDIGIVEGNLHGKVHHAEVVSEDNMVIVASGHHPLVKRSGTVSLQELEHETWVLREKGSGTREAADTLFRDLQLTPEKIMEFGSTQIIKESVEAGLGVSLLSIWAIKKELRNGDMGIIPANGLPYKRNFTILRHSSFETKAVQQFIQTLKLYLT
ncbi:LysR family transcriptional regulator [Neobacillus dielmonensis]|uniref:LysR family transcriptional regulator n=1 Tax=Neobacillus dielmonensis TaxID=1347369 RepID=UPI0005A76A40|nr:LysR family transcriptional regulator [Neobacillus dielmonensis]